MSLGLTSITTFGVDDGSTFFSALCVDILMFCEISRCKIWDKSGINIILGYDSQLYEQKKKTEEVAKAKFSKGFINIWYFSL